MVDRQRSDAEHRVAQRGSVGARFSLPVCDESGRGAADARPVLTATTGFPAVTRRATCPKRRALPNDSR
jgi:hypothetical protein